ncbi:MAG: HAMP domain-containing protein [Calditrichales bacterium]|nr:MAG: HAMP domain-containing protein [Calditrichales bacterium]
MQRIFLSIRDRYLLWWQTSDFIALKSLRPIFHFSGLALTFLFIILSIEMVEVKWVQVWVLFFMFFWYQTNRNIIVLAPPPVDLLLLFGLGLTAINNLNLTSLLSTVPEEISLGFLPMILLFLQILTFGLILVINKYILSVRNIIPHSEAKVKIRQGTLFFYIFVGYFGYTLVYFENEYIHYVFQFFLVLSFLNKTAWLERLTKRELVLFFWFYLLIFYYYLDPSGLQAVNFIESEQKLSWFGLPLYLHLLFKMYLLAVIIKIPLVIIYNHATLARKMRIASLFQSTFPQLIQFVFLFFLFFALISTWQAENLRDAIDHQIYEIQNGRIDAALNYEKVRFVPGATTIYVTEYLPVDFLGTDMESGILSLTKTHKRAKRDFNMEDYFLYVKTNNRDMYLVKIDTAFVSLLTKDLSILAGTGLVFYPFQPKEWQKFVFDLQLLDDNRPVRIYPFGIASLNDSWSIVSKRVFDSENDTRMTINSEEDIFAKKHIILGRLYSAVLNPADLNKSYFAGDVYIDLNTLFSLSAFSRVLWIVLLLFLLFNTLVIRQVGKFGSQIHKIILQRFSQLKIGIQQITRGNLDYKFDMEGEDEFVELAEHFNQMSIKLKHTIAEAREKERLDHELKIAHQVQLGLLPSKLPEIRGYNVAAAMQTANEIGGDFYDILSLDKHKFLFTIGDVSGKGSSAAFYMAQFISLFRFSQQYTDNPEEIAIRMNQYFSTHIEDRQIFITAIIGVLDLKKDSVEFVRAGHTLPILVPGDENADIIEIDSKGLGLGLTRADHTFRKRIELQKVKLQDGDVLVLYTDGVIEAAHPADTNQSTAPAIVYGEERFSDLLKKHRNQSASELVSTCMEDLNVFYKNHPRVDDHTLFFIHKKPKL